MKRFDVLVVKAENGNESVIGEAKPGFIQPWLYAFEPAERVSNLKEVEAGNESSVIHRYETTVKNAQERLTKLRSNLVNLEEKPLLFEQGRMRDFIERAIAPLQRALMDLEDDDILFLDQSERAKRAMKENVDADSIIQSMNEWQEFANDSAMSNLNLVNITLEEMIEDTANNLPSEPKEDFFNELVNLISYEESGHGPNAVSDLFMREKVEKSDVPKEAHRHALGLLLEMYQKEGVDLDGYPMDDRDIVLCNRIMVHYIRETLTMMTKFEEEEYDIK